MSKSSGYNDDKKPLPPNYSDEPPSYSEATEQQYNKGETPHDTKKEPLPEHAQQQQQQQFQSNDPNINPNVYVVPPQLVDITRSNPQHLNPAYPTYLERERERNIHGDYPNPDRYKHGAPLNFSNVPKNNTTSKNFPGRAGATYNNAANK